jgi:hypothetical protein
MKLQIKMKKVKKSIRCHLKKRGRRAEDEKRTGKNSFTFLLPFVWPFEQQKRKQRFVVRFRETPLLEPCHLAREKERVSTEQVEEEERAKGIRSTVVVFLCLSSPLLLS